MKDDATLVELARSGDSAAFAELYERYFDRVHDFLARMVRDSSEAADLTQDTFLKAMNSLPSLSKGASFKSWLFTIARNSALNRIERASRTQPLESTNDEGEEQSYDVIDADRFGNPEEAAEAASLAAVVWEAASALEPKYRSVLMLNLREGLDSAEIADVMGVTKNHAYVLVNRMKAALESAVGAVALFRNGRRHCAELAAVLDKLQIAELSPDARRVIERHAGNCDTCQEQRRKLTSPFAIFAGMALVEPAPGLKESIFSSLQAGFAYLGSGADAPTGANSQPGESPANAANGQGSYAAPAANAAHSNGLSTGLQSLSGGDHGGAGDGGSDMASGDAENSRWARRRIGLVAAAAALLLLIGGPIAAVSFLGGNEPGEVLAIVGETPTATTSAPSSVAATSTPSPTIVTTALAGAAATQTPTPAPSTPAADTGEPGGPGEAGGPGATTPVPIGPGGGDPGVAAPPTVTPDANAPPPGGNPQVVAPPPATATPTAPATLTPAPCFYSMSASSGELVFSARNATQTFVLEGEGCGSALAYTAQPGASWIIVTPGVGSIPVAGQAVVTVQVDVANRQADSGRVHVSSLAGEFDILVRIDAPTSTPTSTPTLRSGNGNLCGVNCTATPTPTTPSFSPPNNFTN